jgi:molybdopterin/thiamine biosynthesis adenylyltransferase
MMPHKTRNEVEPQLEALPEEAPVVTTVNEHVRYDRQERIWGKEGQRKIQQARVAIVGDGPFAKYLALPLAALGVGELNLIGDSWAHHEHLMDVPVHDEYRVDGYARALHLLNPMVRVIPIPMRMDTRLPTAFLRDATIIVDATNDPQSKALVFSHAKDARIPVLTGSVGAQDAVLRLWKPGEELLAPHFSPQYEGLLQDPVLALLWGGLASEEVKKALLGEKEQLPRVLHYQAGNAERFVRRKEGPVRTEAARETCRDKSALVVGAGALGNIATMALAELGFGSVDYVDCDSIESHNLNRQVLFYDAVGLPKADVLARKHHTIDPQSRTRGIVQKLDMVQGRFTIEELAERSYDIAFDLVDNLYARALLSAYAVQRGIPLISAASSPEAGQVASYAPGRTACLDHVFTEYYERGRREEIVRRQSCIAQPDPSVIVTNQVAGALAALEARALLSAEPTTLVNGSIKYDTKLPFRLGATPIDLVCDCHEHPERIPNLEIAPLVPREETQ